VSDTVVGVGRSSAPESFTAGCDAATQALGGREAAGVLLVFGSTRFDHRRLLEGVTSVAGDTPLVGGTTAGEISSAEFSTRSVVVMALSSDTLSFTTGIGKDMSRDEAACGVALVEDIRRQTSLDDALSLLVLPNGMGGDGVKVIEGLHSALGPNIEIVGGYLGDDERFESTFQYHDGKVYKDAIPGLLFSGQGFRTGVGVRSGFASIGNRFYCTQAKGNVVGQFDEERALDVYKEFLGEELSKKLPGVCLEYPFGLIDEKVSIRGKEYFQLRCGLSVDHERGTISLAASIPEGSPITLTTASRGDIINGARLAAEQAQESLAGAKPQAVLMFSCVGRKLVLGRRTQEEVSAVRSVLGEDVPLLGFYTYGEIGPIDKMQGELAATRFHNETVVVWALGSD